MSEARRLVPSQTHFLTRRTRNRCAFLRPAEDVNQLVLYCLGRAQQLAPGVQLHTLMVSTTHTHAGVTDAPAESQLPRFQQNLHSLLARSLNAYYGRGENLWSQPDSYSNVEVHDPTTLEEQLLYVWTNPVKDGLCARPEAWPGVRFLPEDFGTTIRVKKPAHAFFGGRRPEDWEPGFPSARRANRAALRRRDRAERRAQGRRARKQPGRRTHSRLLPAAPKARAPRHRRRRETLPDEVEVTISVPPGYEHLTLEETRAYFRERLDARVAEIHAARAEAGLSHFMGIEAILAQDPLDSVGDTYPTFARDPRIACLVPGLRPALLRGLQLWRAARREALELWRAGQRDVLFPAGTYRHHVFYGDTCMGSLERDRELSGALRAFVGGGSEFSFALLVMHFGQATAPGRTCGCRGRAGGASRRRASARWPQNAGEPGRIARLARARPHQSFGGGAGCGLRFDEVASWTVWIEAPPSMTAAFSGQRSAFSGGCDAISEQRPRSQLPAAR